MALPPETAGIINSTGSDSQAALVPLRELQMLTVAAGFAQQIHAGVILWGVQYESAGRRAVFADRRGRSGDQSIFGGHVAPSRRSS